jgi:predicted XRE-type DNA-binding protein
MSLLFAQSQSGKLAAMTVQMCEVIISMQSKVYVETAIQMAIQQSKVYHLMQQAFKMFEEGELKSQKNRAAHKTEVSKKKAMQGHFSAKIHHFKVFQGLQVSIDKFRNTNKDR